MSKELNFSNKDNNPSSSPNDYKTIPGSMMSKKIFDKIGLFYENVILKQIMNGRIEKVIFILMEILITYDPLNYYPINSNILGS